MGDIPEGLSRSGIFDVQALRLNFGGGLNVNTSIGSPQ